MSNFLILKTLQKHLDRMAHGKGYKVRTSEKRYNILLKERIKSKRRKES
jgi:hypothetical protein